MKVLHKDPQYAPLTAPDTISRLKGLKGGEVWGGGGPLGPRSGGGGGGGGREEVHLARGLAR